MGDRSGSLFTRKSGFCKVGTGGSRKKIVKACMIFGLDPPCPSPPLPINPLPVTPPGQKGYQSVPFSNRHPYSSRPKTEVLQSYGAKQKIRTSMQSHVTYQAPITGLHSPTLLPFLQISTDYLILARSCKFGVICCFIDLTHPAART